MARIALAGSLVLGTRASITGLPTGPALPNIWSPTDKQSGIALTENTARATSSTFSAGINGADTRSAGVLQFEVDHLSTPNGNVSIGVTSSNITFNTAMQGSAGSAYIRNGFIGRGTATSEQTVTALATNDVVGFVVDFTAQTITYYKNGVQLGVPSSTSLMTAALKIKAYAQSTATFGLRLRVNKMTYPVVGALEWTPDVNGSAWSPVDKNAGVTLSNAYNKAVAASTSQTARGTAGHANNTGEWQLEYTITDVPTAGSTSGYMGFAQASTSTSSNIADEIAAVSVRLDGATYNFGGPIGNTGMGTLIVGDVITLRLDTTGKYLWMKKNGVDTGFVSLGSLSGLFTNPVYPAMSAGSGAPYGLTIRTKNLLYPYAGVAEWG